MTDAQLWEFLGRRCYPDPAPNDEWNARAKAAILSEDIPGNAPSGMAALDAARYICRLLRVLLEVAGTDAMLSRDPAAGDVTGDELRAAFVRGIALRGGDPMETSLLFTLGMEEAELRELVKFDVITPGREDCIGLTGTGRVVADTVSNGGRPKSTEVAIAADDTSAAYGDDLRDISVGLEAAIDAAESMFQFVQELAIEPKWDLKRSDFREGFDVIVGHLADDAGDGLAARLNLMETVSQITDPMLGEAILKSSSVPDRSIDTKIKWINRELTGSGRSPVSTWVSVIPQVPRRDATVTGKTGYFLSWHEAALSIARKLLVDRLQTQYTLESWLSCWAKTKWHRILAGIREERLFLERSNAFAGAEPVTVQSEVTETISADAIQPTADDNGNAAGEGMSWEKVAERLGELKGQGVPFTSQRKMAVQIGCKLTVLNKAIQKTPDLQPWARSNGADPKAQSLGDVTLDQTAQATECDPAEQLTDDDAEIVMRQLIEEAPEEKRGELQAAFARIPHEERKRLIATWANRDDRGDMILGRKA